MSNFSSPNIFEETLGPCECPPYIEVCTSLFMLSHDQFLNVLFLTFKMSVSTIGRGQEGEGQSREGVAITLVAARLNTLERIRDRFRLLRCRYNEYKQLPIVN
jgi:hypothetical protein